MTKVGCFLVAFMLMPLSALAGDFTLFGGFQKPGSITIGDAASGAGEVLSDPLNAGVFGIRAGQGGVVGSEYTLAYAPNFLDSNSRAFIMHSNVMVEAPLFLARPYVTAGVGAFFVRGSGPSDIGTKLAFNYGGGVKFIGFGPVGGRIDVRGHSLPRVSGETLNLLEVSLGVLFRF